MAATRTDQIMAELIGLGYTTGTINDRERKRLLVKTGSSGVGKTLDDLYTLANEANRLYGDRSAGSSGGATLVINDDGNGNLSTTSSQVTDDLTGNLATTSTDVTDTGTGILTSA